jgi:hypothetical protein
MSTVSDKALRVRMRRWSDPRLWVGVLVVVAAVLLGARFLANAADTVAVSALAHDVPAGTPLGADDLRTTRVHFEDDSTAARYYPASFALPTGARAGQDLSAGQLLARSAVSTDAEERVELPLAVDAAGFPAGLVAGDRVDVWAVRDRRARNAGGIAGRVARDVVVLASVADQTASGQRRVLVGLSPGEDAKVADMLEALHGADVILVRHGH